MTAAELIKQRQAADLQSRLASPELRARILADPFIRAMLDSKAGRMRPGTAVDMTEDETHVNPSFGN